MLWPVTQRPSSPARNATTSAMSAGSPIRPSAVSDSSAFWLSSEIVVAEQVGVGGARQHRVDRDATLAKLVRGDSAEQFECGLARGVRRHPLPDHHGVEGRDVDHPAAVAQALRGLPDQYERALHVHVERGVEDLVAACRRSGRLTRRRRCSPGCPAARAVPQRGRTAGLPSAGSPRSACTACAVPPAAVSRQRLRRPRRRSPIAEYDRRAVRGQPLDDGPADTPRAAGHQCCLVPQFSHSPGVCQA